MNWGSVVRCAAVVVAGTACLLGSVVEAGPFKLFGSRQPADYADRMQAISQVPMKQLHPVYRNKVDAVFKNPTVYVKGPVETFLCDAKMYRWFLDHPDRTVLAWRRMGAKCLDITDRGNGYFGWSDPKGSDVVWNTVYPGAELRVWYAEGQVKPGKLLPMVPVQGVVILRHQVVGNKKEAAVMQHQADVFVYSSSKTAALISRMLGPSVPHMAKQSVAQLQMFFAAMAWYCQQHPHRVEALLKPASTKETDQALRLSPFEELNQSKSSSPIVFPKLIETNRPE